MHNSASSHSVKEIIRYLTTKGYKYTLFIEYAACWSDNKQIGRLGRILQTIFTIGEQCHTNNHKRWSAILEDYQS